MSDTKAEPGHRKLLLPPLILCGALLLTYSNSFSNPFLIDDRGTITENPLVLENRGLKDLWTTDYWGGRVADRNTYRPFTVLSYHLNARLPGVSERGPDGNLENIHPASFRFFNVLILGLLGCLLAFWLQGFVTAPVAWSLATIFTLHPNHATVINNVVGRADLLAMLGVTGFLLFQFRWHGHAARPLRLIALSGFGLLAVWTKESGMVLFPLAVAQDWLLRKNTAAPRTFLQTYRIASVALASSAVYLMARIGAIGWWTPFQPDQLYELTGNPIIRQSFFERLPAALSIATFYCTQFFLPSTTHWSVPEHLPTWSSLSTWLGICILLSVLWGIWLGWRKDRQIGLPALLALGSYAIVGNLLFPIGAYAGNRLAVPFLIAMAVALAFGLQARFSNQLSPRICFMATGVVGLFFSLWIMLGLNPRWSSYERLMEYDLKVRPNDPAVRYLYATALLEQADDLARDPALITSGSSARELNEKAVTVLARLAEEQPESAPIRYQFAGAYWKLGRADQAQRQYRLILETDPTHLAALNQSAVLEMQTRQLDIAESLLNRMLAIDPQHANALHNLAIVAFMRQDWSAALERYRRLLHHHPRHDPGLQEYRELSRQLGMP